MQKHKLPFKIVKEMEAFKTYVLASWSMDFHSTFEEQQIFIQQMLVSWESRNWQTVSIENKKIEPTDASWEEVWSKIYFEITEPLEIEFNHKKNETASSMVNFIQLVAITIYVLAIGFALYFVGIRW